MDIKQFLRLPHRFVWGGAGLCPNGVWENDCTTFCASWVEEMTGYDPAASYRGTYSDQEGAHAVLQGVGGIEAMLAREIEPLGFYRVTDPHDGDVGIIRTIAGLGYAADIAAVRFGPLWATLGHGGVAAKKSEFITAWRRPC